jgi:hypothetical protein
MVPEFTLGSLDSLLISLGWNEVAFYRWLFTNGTLEIILAKSYHIGKWENWGPGKVRDLTKISQPVRGEY